jgi:hypothetical protein
MKLMPMGILDGDEVDKPGIPAHLPTSTTKRVHAVIVCFPKQSTYIRQTFTTSALRYFNCSLRLIDLCSEAVSLDQKNRGKNLIPLSQHVDTL